MVSTEDVRLLLRIASCLDEAASRLESDNPSGAGTHLNSAASNVRALAQSLEQATPQA
jgi:hypothetical protein